MKNIILTGDRPTGKLHLGHYVGSLKNRVKIQDDGNFDKMFIMIADSQALTDNFKEPSKVRENIIEVLLDYLSVGLNPEKVHIFIQSEVSALTELTFYYQNFVTLARLMRNPTVKDEIVERGFDNNIPMGFLAYPISQAADITAFKANIVPVGQDQIPVIEQTREIVKSINSTYNTGLVMPEAIVPKEEFCARLPGTDGKNKMSKSLNNSIYLSDSEEDIKKKVMSMYTDPDHISISDPGKIEGNVVFTYLDVFANDNDFKKHLPEYNNLDELKEHYQRGGLGDVVIKNFLNNVLQDFLRPIREKRLELEKNKEYLYKVLKEGTEVAIKEANNTLKELKDSMKINYFANDNYLNELIDK